MRTYLFLMSVFVAGTAMAGAPQFSTKCPVARGIRQPVNGQGFFMSSDCLTAYVLPPARGTMEVMGRSVGNLQRCREVGDVNRALATVNLKIQKAIENGTDNAIVTEAVSQRTSILTAYSDLARTEAASVELNFSLAVDENVRSFQEQNRNISVRFVPVAIKNVKLKWNSVKSSDSEMQIAFNKDVPVPDLNSIGAGSFSARLDLSLFGACPLRDVFTHEIPRKIRSRDLVGIITPNVTYSYEVGAVYSYKAFANKGALARKIRQNSTSGGFFNTSTASSLVEKAESSGWFKLESECEDSRVCESAKVETALQIKQRLMAEVLENITLSKFGFFVAPPEAGSPGKNGASASADALRQCPHMYCQVGALLLDVASATLGSTSKTDDYISKNDHMVEEEVNESKPVEFTGIMGFGR